MHYVYLMFIGYYDYVFSFSKCEKPQHFYTLFELQKWKLKKNHKIPKNLIGTG